MVRQRNPLHLWFLLAAAVSSAAASGQRPGDLVVTPPRILLDEKRGGNITLLNRGTETVRYRLSLVDMEMLDNGALRRIPEKGAFSGIDYFRFSPREIVLQPGESQRIRIISRFPIGRKDGEYRSHLAFEPIAARKLPSTVESGPQSLTLRFDVRSVVTIPIVARQGLVTASSSLSGVQLVKEADGWHARFRIGRVGNRMVRGDVAVSFISAAGKRSLLGSITSLPVYFPNGFRDVDVLLKGDVASFGKGEIEVTFTDPDRARGASVVKAIATVAG